MLHTRRFDQSMMTFLDLLKQLLDYISEKDPSIRWPHRIYKDKVGDNSIKLPGQFITSDKNGDEEWTRALRGLLGTCKVLINYATSE